MSKPHTVKVEDFAHHEIETTLASSHIGGFSKKLTFRYNVGTGEKTFIVTVGSVTFGFDSLYEGVDYYNNAD
jgi:hypothetical protein